MHLWCSVRLKDGIDWSLKIFINREEEEEEEEEEEKDEKWLRW